VSFPTTSPALHSVHITLDSVIRSIIVVQCRIPGPLKCLCRLLYLYAYSRETLLSRMTKFSSKVFPHLIISIYISQRPSPLFNSCGLCPPDVLLWLSRFILVSYSHSWVFGTSGSMDQTTLMTTFLVKSPRTFCNIQYIACIYVSLKFYRVATGRSRRRHVSYVFLAKSEI
jgi:hypothetical protein